MKLRLSRPKMNSFFLVLSPAAKVTMKKCLVREERNKREQRKGLYRNHEAGF